MQNSIDIGWLDIGLREDFRPAILDHGRLQRVVAELPDPENQYPSLCVFLGGKARGYALQQLCPLNNIKRHVSKAQIKLRPNIASLESVQPILLADGEILQIERFWPKTRIEAGMGLPVSWDSYSAGKMLLVIWARLIFVFTDVVCISIDDIPDLDKVVHFLVGCLELRSASSFSQALLPRVIFIYGTEVKKEESNEPNMDLLHRKIRERGYKDLSGIFSGTVSMYLQDDHISDTARFQRLKALIAEQVDAISFIRQEYQTRPNGTHFMALFQSAVQHTLHDISKPFDLVTATRKDRPVCLCAESRLVHYLEIGHRANFLLTELAPSVASALFMDHYVPEMLGLIFLFHNFTGED